MTVTKHETGQYQFDGDVITGTFEMHFGENDKSTFTVPDFTPPSSS